MTTTRLPTSLIPAASQNCKRLKEIFLVSVTASALLLGSLGGSRAQDADATMAAIKLIESQAPAGSISSDTQKEIDAANTAGTDYFNAKEGLKKSQSDAATAKTQATQAASDVTVAQKAVNDAQAKADAVNKAYSGAASADAALTKAVTNYNTEKGWLDTATKSVSIANQGQAAFDAALKSTDPDVKKAVAGYSSADFAKFKADAAMGFSNAQTKTWAAQYAAQVASDAVKDSKNGLAVRQDANVALQSAKTGLTLAQQASTTANTTLASANAASTTAQQKVNTTGAAAASQATKAFNDANSDMTKNQNKQASTPATPGNVAVVTPPSGTPVVTPAPIVVTPGASGAAIISEAGGALVSNNSGTLVSNNSGTLVSNNSGTLVSNNSGTLVGNAGGTLVGNAGGTILGNNGTGIVSNAGSGVLTDNGMLATGSGLISEHGAGAIAQSSALLATLPTAAAQQVTASAAFKQDSTISANANITTPDQDLKNAVGRLSTQDTKTLSDLKAQVASGKPLTADQANQVSVISDKIAKNMDPANVKSLQASIATKSGTSTGSPSSAPSTAVAAQPAAAPAAQTTPSSVVAMTSNPTVTTPVATTASPAAPSSAQAGADLKGLTPAALQQLVLAGPAVVQGLQAQQQAALDKGDRTTADALGKDIVNVQAQIAYAKSQPAASSAPAVSASAAPATSSTTPSASTLATQVAAAPGAEVTKPIQGGTVSGTTAGSPANPEIGKLQQGVAKATDALQTIQKEMSAAQAKGDTKTEAALRGQLNTAKAQVDSAKSALAKAETGTTPPSVGHPTDASGPQVAALKPDAAASTSPTLASTPSKPAEVKTEQAEAPAKLTADQGKVVHQALRTIPGNLNKSERTQFDALSSLVDKATTKGLTPVEAAMLKAGLAALADKHPKAEKQHGLNAIGTSFANAHRGEEKPAIATREGSKPELGKPVGAPPMMPAAATTLDKNKGVDTAKQKGPDIKPEQTIARTNPTAGEKKDTIPEHHTPNGTAPVAHANPTSPPSLGGGGAGEKKDMIPEHHMQQPPKQAAVPVAPKPVTPPPVAPKPTIASGGAPKMAAPPAPKPQSCTPNMVGGKTMGMICH
jgi:hypothetical protein